MILLDTNVLSEIQKPVADAGVEAWFKRTDAQQIHVCAPVMMEQAFGSSRFFLKTGSRRYLDIFERAKVEFAGRILAFDGAASEVAGRLRATRENAGRPISVGDAMIAAICLVHGAVLATRNVRDFGGLDLTLVNPFEALA